jgi:lipopolysaccharide biosynthesis regulator YciM
MMESIKDQIERQIREHEYKEMQLKREHECGLHYRKNVEGCPICRKWLSLKSC